MLQEEFEKIIMEKLLDHGDEFFGILREQYLHSAIISREFTGYGFFTSFSVPEKSVVNNMQGDIHDVVAIFENSDEVYGFRLTIDGGKIDTLEGFSTYGEWNYNYEKAELDYNSNDGKRIYEIR